MEQSTDIGGPANGSSSSTRPYLIRALHDWCTDNGFTPYIAVHVDSSVQVPTEYVSKNEIVLNVGFDATSNLELGNEFVQFKARFGGVAREIIVPVDHVVAIYARENGQGMAFPAPSANGAPVATALDKRNPAGTHTRRPVTPLRGLRLASSPESNAEALTGLAKPAAAADDPQGPGDDPDGSPAGGGNRPALKLVK